MHGMLLHDVQYGLLHKMPWILPFQQGFYPDFRCLALVKNKQGKSHDVKTKVPVNYRLAWKNSVIHSQKGFDINSVFISHDTSARSNKLIKFHSIWPEI